VDEIETGAPTGGRVRIAVRVDDLEPAAEAVAGVGAEALAEPVLNRGATVISGSGPRTAFSSPCSLRRKES
jgi:hypothetical protein